MKFPIPLNDLIGPSMSLTLLAGAVGLAFVAILYRAYLQRQEDSWAKAGK